MLGQQKSLARICHNEQPAKSDAVKFFLHILETDPYSSFNFKANLCSHFQRLLGTPEKALFLTNSNFVTKVNPSRKYPAYENNTANLFDDDRDAIFNFKLPTSPDPATPTLA